ncbi:MAG: CRISPR-associated endonuclease Cas2 [Bacillales bacterium]|jgi:CRISPR-associated protein Cas2|nr:CRISPR-associated endonuclease Cas2 [Bacillales bacterium]
MRLLIFFDLPTITVKDKREYNKFRKFLVKNGFLMKQESVYSKIVINRTTLEIFKKSIKKNAPSNGIVEMLEVTEKQYCSIEYIVGKKQEVIIDSDERVVRI